MGVALAHLLAVAGCSCAVFPLQRLCLSSSSLLFSTSAAMPTQLGVPVKLLHECEGHKVSVELTNGEIYRGMLVDAEDCMNLQLQQVVRRAQRSANDGPRRARAKWVRE